MAVKFTEEQLNSFDKSLLVQLLVAQKDAASDGAGHPVQ